MNRGTITYVQGVALYVGAVLGSGILILPSYTAVIAGPASILSWLILSLLSAPLAYTFARLALKYKNFGGIATIVQHAFGSIWSAIVGWFFFIWVATGQAVVGLTGAGYLVEVFQLPKISYYLLAILFLLIALIFNLFGMKTSGLFSLLLSGAVLILLLITILFSLPYLDRTYFQPFLPHGLQGIGRACALIFWAFFGWESITHLVPEFKNPNRDVMRSTWTSVVLIGIVYTLLAFVTVGTHNYGEHEEAAPLATLMNQSLGLNAGFATALIACIVCLGTLNVFLASSSRLGYALAREQKFPAWFEKLSKKGVPYRSAIILFSSNSTMVILSYIYGLSLDKLIFIPTTLGISVYVIASFACIKLLWRDQIGKISAILAACCCLFVLPFAFDYILVPIIVTIACLFYIKKRAVSARKYVNKSM